MEKAKEWKPEYYSQSTLKGFGFTAKMIETMLSEPILKKQSALSLCSTDETMAYYRS